MSVTLFAMDLSVVLPELISAQQANIVELTAWLNSRYFWQLYLVLLGTCAMWGFFMYWVRKPFTFGEYSS